jgi:hypothetical protein
VKFGNAGDVFVELLQTVLNGRDLERVGKPGISVSRLFGLGNDGELVLMAHGNERRMSRGRNMGLPRHRSRSLAPGHHPIDRP